MSVNLRRYSLVQMIAVTTATAAAIALFSVLSWPPLGRTGLIEACLPGAILLAALWFCGRVFAGRMVLYSVVGASLAVLFLLKWMAATDLFFGHRQGPPTWIIAAAVCSCVALTASVAWFVAWVVGWYRGTRQDDRTDARNKGYGPILRAVGMGGVVIVSGLVALATGSEVSKAWRRLDYYIEDRLINDRRTTRQWAEQLAQRDLPKRGEMAARMASQLPQPGDEAAVATLAELLADGDPQVRRGAAETLRQLIENAGRVGTTKPVRLEGAALAGVVAVLDDPDPVVRQHAASMLRPIAFNDPGQLDELPASVVEVLLGVLDRPEPEAQRLALAIISAMGPKAASAVEPLTEFKEKAGGEWRAPITTTLSRIQPQSSQAVDELSVLLTKPYDAHARSMAARQLGELGPAARRAVPAFVEAWEKRMLTIEDAQELYLIDEEAAARAGIPRAGERP